MAAASAAASLAPSLELQVDVPVPVPINANNASLVDYDSSLDALFDDKDNDISRDGNNNTNHNLAFVPMTLSDNDNILEPEQLEQLLLNPPLEKNHKRRKMGRGTPLLSGSCPDTTTHLPLVSNSMGVMDAVRMLEGDKAAKAAQVALAKFLQQEQGTPLNAQQLAEYRKKRMARAAEMQQPMEICVPEPQQPPPPSLQDKLKRASSEQLRNLLDTNLAAQKHMQQLVVEAQAARACAAQDLEDVQQEWDKCKSAARQEEQMHLKPASGAPSGRLHNVACGDMKRNLKQIRTTPWWQPPCRDGKEKYHEFEFGTGRLFECFDGSKPTPNDDAKVLLDARRRVPLAYRPYVAWTEEEDARLRNAVVAKLLKDTMRVFAETPLVSNPSPPNLSWAQWEQISIDIASSSSPSPSQSSFALSVRTADACEARWRTYEAFHARRDHAAAAASTSGDDTATPNNNNNNNNNALAKEKVACNPDERTWTEEETTALLCAIKACGDDYDFVERQQHGKPVGGNWDEIAKAVGGGRTAFGCLSYWMQNHNPNVFRTTWTEEEDAALVAAVTRWGADWRKVAEHVPRRSPAQCHYRYTRMLMPARPPSEELPSAAGEGADNASASPEKPLNERHRVKGKWATHEDEALVRAVDLVGETCWRDIAAHVPGRSDAQCRERWCNILDPKLNKGPWSEEEDRRLLDAARKCKVANADKVLWSAVSSLLNGMDPKARKKNGIIPPSLAGRYRTDFMCLSRFRQIINESSDSIFRQEAMEIFSRPKKRKSAAKTADKSHAAAAADSGGGGGGGGGGGRRRRRRPPAPAAAAAAPSPPHAAAPPPPLRPPPPPPPPLARKKK